MPTWTWIIDSDGSKLDGGYDFTDAYNGGTSIQFYGDLDANKANDIMLYSTDVAVTDGMTLSLTAKNDDGKARLVAYYGDDSTASYEECETVAYDLTASEADTWTTTVVDISDHAGKTLYAIGLKVESDTAVSDYHINLGQLAILDQDRAALSGPTSVALDEILYHNAYDAEARIYWDAVDGAASYEIYKVNANGTSNLIMETPNTAFYLPTLVRDFDEDDVTLKVVPVNANGVRGEGTELIIDWLYSNEDSEVYEPKEFENVCLGATVIGYSGQNESEPASKAIDGTSLNGSKWCVTNAETGYMDIDIGREVTVRRWRVEHAQYGGEDVLMNTVDFALEYKNASGWWVEAKRIQHNTAAVTDVLLDEPVTAQKWRLRIYDDGTSPWGGIRIYEWQMFETAEFPQTEPVSIQFAAAENGTGANDTFTLKNVPAGQTVTVYTKSGSEYNKIGEAVAESGTVTITGLNFGTQEAGRIYYTTTATGSAESIKLSASFEAENAAKSEAARDVTAEAYSQPGSVSSSNGGDIYISLTVNGLSEGDVVYVYENNSGEYTKASLPVAAGETSVIIRGIRVPRAGSELTLQVKRVSKLISDKYTVKIPAFPEPTAFLNLVATNAKGEKLTGVTYGVYNSNNEKVYTVTTGEPAEVVLGTYTIKCENVPEGYLINDTVVKRLVVTEGQTYDVNVTLQSDSVGPIVTSVTVSPATASVEKGATKQFAAMVNGENITDHSVTWSVDGAVSEATEIDETGLLTVAEDETAEQLTVVATSVQDPNVSGSAAVTVTEPVGELELVSQNATIVGYNGKKLGTTQSPEKLFDGDKENPDTGKWCEDGSNLWVAFDIGEERNVRQLVVSHVGVAETPTAGNGSMNTANYEFYVLNEEKVNVDELLAMEAEERNAVLADAANWTERAKTTDNAADVTTNDLGDATGRIFKLNVSRTDTTGWAACVRIYEAELYATAKPTEPVVDKTILNQLIEQASARVEDDYTTTSWAAFATALAEAQSISAAEDANQVTVNHAADALQDAMESLVKRADNSNLVAAIDSIKELDESRYQPDSWAALAQALAEAEKVAANRDATADEIEAAYTNLEAAYKALALRADMTAIDDMISKVEAMDANAHTAKSWKLVADALEAAKTVAANENATQEAVDAAARTLQAAAAALVKAGDATELNALVEETKQLDLSKYTVESADAIRQAISDAEAAIAGRASAEDLKAALDAVRNAVNTAQTKPAAPVQKPADTVKPVQKPADTVKDEHPDIAGGIANGTWGAAPTAKPNDGSAAASGSGATSAIPQTSDNFPYEVLSILACLAVGGFIVALYLKKRSGNR
ncbi:GH85 family endohexosaminidase C-terminal domain-containing protein [Gemmiger formicilis]|uniref:GH85 family endohexosaminidase C-terminal domain-containing protein n=2 Tax=Gemmiger formicilis TaxID=745368 RepID=UPI0031199537